MHIEPILIQMTDDIIYESYESRNREALALYLRTVADAFEAGQEIVLPDGDHTVPSIIPEQVTFGATASRDADGRGTWHLSLDFEWPDEPTP
jgi:amphi-Trp domain-containing protein